MYRLKRSIALAVTAAALIAAGSTAWADARLNATQYSTSAPGRVVAVEPLDDSAENLDYREEFVAQLERAGYQVTPNAPVVLYFWLEDYLGGPTGGPSRRLLELGGTKGTAGEDNARVQLNIYSSQGGGLLNDDAGSAGEQKQNPTQVRVGARIRTRTDGERLWEAEALGDIQTLDRDGIIRRLIPPIVRSIGTSVKAEPIKVN